MIFNVNVMNISQKIGTYTKALGLSLAVGLSSCSRDIHVKPDIVFNKADSTSLQLISMLERGDKHAVMLAKPPKGRQVLSIDEISNYIPNDSIGELFYQVYVGKADKAIGKAKGRTKDIVTVGQGISATDHITLAGGIQAKKGDYISSHSTDSITNLVILRNDYIIKDCIGESTYSKLQQHEKDAILAYLHNVDPKILKKAPSGKSFFEYLSEGNKGMVQSKFNISPSSDVAAAGLAKRNLIQLLIFGDGKVYRNKEAQENFKKQVNIIRENKNGKKLLKEALDIVRKYGVNQKNLSKTEEIIFPKAK